MLTPRRRTSSDSVQLRLLLGQQLTVRLLVGALVEVHPAENGRLGLDITEHRGGGDGPVVEFLLQSRRQRHKNRAGTVGRGTLSSRSFQRWSTAHPDFNPRRIRSASAEPDPTRQRGPIPLVDKTIRAQGLLRAGLLSLLARGVCRKNFSAQGASAITSLLHGRDVVEPMTEVRAHRFHRLGEHGGRAHQLPQTKMAPTRWPAAIAQPPQLRAFRKLLLGSANTLVSTDLVSTRSLDRLTI